MEKRTATNLKKYGVANSAQTKIAKSKHAEFYADQEKVNTAVEQAKSSGLIMFAQSQAVSLLSSHNSWLEMLKLLKLKQPGQARLQV